MTVNANRFSVYTTGSGGSDAKNGEQKKDLWNTMLSSVASGKRLPEKNLLVLGGTTESQRELLEALSQNRQTLDRQSARAPPVANSFALGYTYYDVLDTDQEDTLARISLYLLSTPSPSFTSLLQPLLTPETIPNTLIVVLLDWAQPNLWLRQLREWLLLLREVVTTLGAPCKDAMEEVMTSWRDRGRGGGSVNLDGTGSAAAATGDGDVALPLGPGEWDDGLGLPLCVVCQNAERMEYLEKSQGWKEADFDQVLQYLRTILLRHGASLIYTTPNVPSPLQNLVHSSLGISSLGLKRQQPLKHNVIDRDKILVPPNWDSWGKIRVLRDGFEVEEVSIGWSDDLGKADLGDPPITKDQLDKMRVIAQEDGLGPVNSAVALYEDWVRDPETDAFRLAAAREGGIDGGNGANKPEVVSKDTQTFLEEQLRILEAFRTRAAEGRDARGRPIRGGVGAGASAVVGDEGRFGAGRRGDEIAVSDHIGPVQFNVGGISVDADDMLQRLKERNAYGGTSDAHSPAAEGETDGLEEPNKEKLEAFFTGLMNRGSAMASPRPP